MIGELERKVDEGVVGGEGRMPNRVGGNIR
jgi:hypothetical protein